MSFIISKSVLRTSTCLLSLLYVRSVLSDLILCYSASTLGLLCCAGKPAASCFALEGLQKPSKKPSLDLEIESCWPSLGSTSQGSASNP